MSGAEMDLIQQLREALREYRRVTNYILDPNIKRLDRDVLRRLAESALLSDTPASSEPSSSTATHEREGEAK